MMNVIPDWAPNLRHYVEHGPAHMRPIVKAVIEYQIACMLVVQNEGTFRVPCDRPTLLIMGDDLHQALGPVAFPRKSVNDFVRRCAACVIVSSGPELLPYTLAAGAVGEGRKHVVLVETLPRYDMAWLNYLRSMNPKMGCHMHTVRRHDTGSPTH